MTATVTLLAAAFLGGCGQSDDLFQPGIPRSGRGDDPRREGGHPPERRYPANLWRGRRGPRPRQRRRYRGDSHDARAALAGRDAGTADHTLSLDRVRRRPPPNPPRGVRRRICRGRGDPHRWASPPIQDSAQPPAHAATAGAAQESPGQRHLFGAAKGARTPDLLFTRQMLYQLSYSGLAPRRRTQCIGPPPAPRGEAGSAPPPGNVVDDTP
jgi:hypothetical protein